MTLKSVLFLTQKYIDGDRLTEYPKEISDFLKNNDIGSYLVCFGEDEKVEDRDGLEVHEFSFKLHGDTYFSWSMLIQTEFLRKIREIVEENDVSIIHANDWLTVPAGMVASKLFGIPLIITYHSIEEERGMDKPHSGHISELERQGIEESSYVIVHNEETRNVMEVYDLPREKVKLIQGGNWKEKLYKIYTQVDNVSSERNQLKEKPVDQNENFNAYMGVPSA